MTRIALVAILCVVLCANASAGRKPPETYPLCDFLNTIVWKTYPNPGASFYAPSLFAMYDGRFYGPDFFDTSQRPNGGIKLGLELGTWQTPAERDAVVDRIKYVQFHNLDAAKDQIIILNHPEKYTYTPPGKSAHYSGDFYIWLGSSYNATGEWEVRVVVEELVKKKVQEKTYVATFTIDQPFIEDLVSRAAEVTSISNTSTGFMVCFNTPPEVAPGDRWRLRIVSGNDLVWDSPLISFGTPVSGGYCYSGIPSAFEDYTTRLEIRTMGNGVRLDCDTTNKMQPYWSRTSSFFIMKSFTPLP
jgi:hypothetical protein